MVGAKMEEEPKFNNDHTFNLCAAVLCGFLTAMIVHFLTASFAWAFLTYVISGAAYLILFMVLSVRDNEKASN